MSGPLDGLTVFDTTRDPQGAITSMLFADYGARVIKVEPDRVRDEPKWFSVARKAWDRGKWSIRLDLSSETGATRLRQLLPLADVIVTSAHGADAQRWDLDDDTLLAVVSSSFRAEEHLDPVARRVLANLG